MAFTRTKKQYIQIINYQGYTTVASSKTALDLPACPEKEQLRPQITYRVFEIPLQSPLIQRLKSKQFDWWNDYAMLDYYQLVYTISKGLESSYSLVKKKTPWKLT